VDSLGGCASAGRAFPEPSRKDAAHFLKRSRAIELVNSLMADD